MANSDTGILLDATRPIGRLLFKRRLPTGIDRVDLEYLRYFRQRGEVSVLVRFRAWSGELSPAASARLIDALLAPRAQLTAGILLMLLVAFLRPSPRTTRTCWLVNTGHSGLHEARDIALLDRVKARLICFVHDLIPVTHPQFCRPGEDLRHRQRIRTALTKSAGIITNSAATTRELQRFAASEGLPMPLCREAWLSLPRLPEPAPPTLPAGSYFLVVGTIEPRKNHLLLLQIWQHLVATLGNQAPDLVIIGQRGWECQQTFAMLDRASELRGVVHELSRVDDAQLAGWLKGARALLFPSFAEGFGLPLVEALALSVPVIAADLAVFRELAGDIPDYVNTLDGLGWMETILRYYAPDSVERQAQLRRLQHYSLPSWQSHFAIVERFLQELQSR